LHTYLHNSYNTPAIQYTENGFKMLSQEGGDNAEVTNAAMAMLQGDNAAMTMYATST